MPEWSFDSLEAAEWQAFRMRWEAVTGQALPDR